MALYLAQLMQGCNMAYTLLPALQPNQIHARICIRVTRKWEYRGFTDDGPIQHVDLVLADHQANNMYAEIPQEIVENFNAQIEEGRIYEISRIRVANAKNYYKPVDNRYMIYFTFHTKVVVAVNPPSTFSRYVYKLTAFEDLPMHVGNCQNFIDILAAIVEVNEPEMLQPSNNHGPTVTRKLVLQDANGLQTRMTLWGQRATQFNIDQINNSEAKPLITLFVGCLIKTYRTQDYLSGGSACKWYFNPDIPEASEFYNRYENQRIEIRRVAPAPQQVIQPQLPPQQETRYLHDLQRIDPYEFPENGCQCTVTIAKLVPNVSWWFPSCTRCGKTCNQEDTGYVCLPCNNTNYRHKYKLVLIATDGTTEAKMICFSQIAQQIIGKSVEHVMRTFRRGESFPPDIAGIVSHKYTFGITMTKRSYYTRNKSFMVNSIIASYGRQRVIPQPNTLSSHQPNYCKDSGSSTPTNQKAIAPSSTENPVLPPSQCHTPPSSPATVGGSDKQVPALHHLDTSATHSARKRLSYDTSEDEKESDHELPKRTKTDKKTTNQRIGASKVSRSQEK